GGDGGGLWCDAFGRSGCRFCSVTCDGVVDGACIMCPNGIDLFSDFCPGGVTATPTAVPTATQLFPSAAPTASPDGTGGGSGGGGFCRSDRDCGTELTDHEKERMCSDGYAVYCDAGDCGSTSLVAPGAESSSSSGGGLWCDAFGRSGCRFCSVTCNGAVDGACVVCPNGIDLFSEFCPADITASPTATPMATPFLPSSTPTA
ncbi:unnamed protein product, partial [Phaeothamnion confervicola]